MGESRTGHAAGSQDNPAGSFPPVTEDWRVALQRGSLALVDLAVSSYCTLFLADLQVAPAQCLAAWSLGDPGKKQKCQPGMGKSETSPFNSIP